jgi:glycosyltransferase involved in cell wall biosynthesis
MGHRAPESGDAVLDGLLRRVAYGGYFESLRLLDRAAMLLLVVPREGGPGNHTGKLFPYLASGRPILALAPEPNVAAELVRQSHSGIVVPPDDPEAIARGLSQGYAAWKRGSAPAEHNHGLVAGYGADVQVRDWVRLLDDLVQTDSRRARS